MARAVFTPLSLKSRKILGRPADERIIPGDVGNELLVGVLLGDQQKQLAEGPFIPELLIRLFEAQGVVVDLVAFLDALAAAGRGVRAISVRRERDFMVASCFCAARLFQKILPKESVTACVDCASGQAGFVTVMEVDR